MGVDVGPDGYRCRSCGCLVRLTARLMRRSLAPATVKTEVALVAAAGGGRAAAQEMLRPFGYFEFWYLGHRCPGCPAAGCRFIPEYGQKEAETIAEEQNRRLESLEAAAEVEGWKQEVRRRVERDSHIFVAELGERLPAYSQYGRIITADDREIGLEPERLEWDCGFWLRAPSENPRVEEFFDARVLNGEVRISWGSLWHVHVCRAREGPVDDSRHLTDAVSMIERFFCGDLAIYLNRRTDSRLIASSLLQTDPVPEWYLDAGYWQRLGIVAIELISWRADADRHLASPLSASSGEPASTPEGS
jgi:hypothetical protein